MNIIPVVSLLLISFSLVTDLSFAEKCSSARSSNTKLFCYYGKLKDVDSCKCSHIILPTNSDVKSVESLRNKLTGVKILVTVHEFNEGLVDLLKRTKIDGLEVDLKKLESKTDIADFISTARSKLGSDLYTAVSVPVRSDLLAKYYDFKGLSKNVDSFILQTAFLGASTNVTFHPSRLSGLWDMQNADSVVDLMVGMGAPLSKLIIAAPVQAFQFTLQDEKHTAPGSPAVEVKSIARDELCGKMVAANWTLERDQDQAGPYIFRNKEWIAFDDPTSMDIKAKYARVRGLAGLALKDLSQDGGAECGGSLLQAAYNGLSKQSRAPRGAVLQSLEREILTPSRPLDNIRVSPYRITRIIDTEGKIHAVRQDTRTEFECSRQGYFVHPRSCNRFYRCVKFDQHSDEFNVFEFDCPAGLAFDSKVEVCVWPGSLSDGSACSGSSEIAPVPKDRFVCPHEAGYYADPENCRWFFACLDHGQSAPTAYEFRCPFGLVFDQDRLVCEWPWLVPKCAHGYGSGVLVEFHGGAYGAHGGALGVNAAIDAHGAYGGGNGQGNLINNQYDHTGQLILGNYNGLGVLQPVALGGLHGPIEEPVSKVYSSFGENNVGIGGHDGSILFGVGANAARGINGDLHQIGAIGRNDQRGSIKYQGIGLSGSNGDVEGQRFLSATVNGHENGAGQVLLHQSGLDGNQASHGDYNRYQGLDGNLGKSTVTYHGNLRGGSSGGVQHVLVDGVDQIVGVGLADQRLQGIGHSGSKILSNADGQALLHQGLIDGNQANHGVSLGYQEGYLAGLDGNSGKSTVTYHGNFGGGSSTGDGKVSVHGVAGNLGQIGVIGGLDNQRGSIKYQGVDHSGINGEIEGQRILSSTLNAYENDGSNRGGSISYEEGHPGGNLDGNLGKSTITTTYHGNYGGSSSRGDGQISVHGNVENAGQIAALEGLDNQRNSIKYQGIGHSGSSGETEGQRILSSTLNAQENGLDGSSHGGSVSYQEGHLAGNLDGNSGKSTVTYHGNFGGGSSRGDGQVLLHGIAGTVGQIGAVEGLDHQRSSIKYQGIDHSGSNGEIEGQRILSTTLNAHENGLDGRSHGGSIRYQEGHLAGLDGDLGKSTVTYHGNFGGGSSRGDDRQVLTQGVGLIGVGDVHYGSGAQDGGYFIGDGGIAQIGANNQEFAHQRGSSSENFADDGLSHQNGVVFLQNGGLVQDGGSSQIQSTGGKSTVTYHGNLGKSNQIGYSNNKSPIDQASFAFGTKLRGSSNQGDDSLKFTEQRVLIGEHDGSIGAGFGIIQGGQHGGVVLGENNYQGNTAVLEGGDLSGGKIVTYHGNSEDNIGLLNAGPTEKTLIDTSRGSVKFHLRANQQDGGSTSYQNYNRQKSGRVNIVGGGFSAVGVYPNAFKQTTPQIQTVTAAPVSVTPHIPVVTSVPIPTTHSSDILDVYNGNGVVANIPELQVKVQHHGEAIIPNIQQAHTATTGEAVDVVNGGYVYDKPALEFVEGGKSFVHQKIEHQTPEIQKVLFEPGRIELQDNGHQGVVSHAGIERVTPSILLTEQKLATPTPATVSSIQFGTSFGGYQPSVVLKQPVGESVVFKQPHHNVELVRPKLVENVTPIQPVLIENVTPSVHYSTSLLENVTPSVSVHSNGGGPLVEVSTVRPAVSYNQIQHHVGPAQHIGVSTTKPIVSYNVGGTIDSVTPSILVQPGQDGGRINIHTGTSIEPHQDTLIHQIENVTPVSVVHQPIIEHRVTSGSITSIPTASFSYENLGARGFQKQDFASVTQQPISIAQDNAADFHSTFLSSISKGRGFSKLGIQEVTPSVVYKENLIPVQKDVQENVFVNDGNIAAFGKFGAVQPILLGGVENTYHQNNKDRGFVKYSQSVTPAPISHHETLGSDINLEGHQNLFGTYQEFGLKNNFDQSDGGYHYARPTIAFNEGPSYEGLEPAKEEPFVAKKAYVTGHGSGLNNVVYEENYSVTPSPIVSSTPVFVTSTVRPSYQNTVQSVYDVIPSTSVKPLDYYYHDSRYSSTPKPFEIKSSLAPIVTVNKPKFLVSTTPTPIIDVSPVEIAPQLPITQSKPILKYSFSSFDHQYSSTPSPDDVNVEVTKRPIITPFAVKSTTALPLQEIVTPLYQPTRAYLPPAGIVENYQAPVLKHRKIVKVIRPPASQAIVKVNDFHPLLSAKLGAQCTCITDAVRFRNKPVKVKIDDGETVEEFVVNPNNAFGEIEGESIKGAYVDPQYEPQGIIDVTPVPEVTIGSTTPILISRPPLVVRKRVRVRPLQTTAPTIILPPVSKISDIFLKSTAVPNYQLTDDQIINGVKSNQVDRQTLSAHNFDRYGPGGLRSKTETLQGTIDCQRAGLFRHPTQCNKFYSCRWDCNKNKFTLHIFNCPVHLTFDDSLGACNWPSQGPACLGNTLLPSD